MEIGLLIELLQSLALVLLAISAVMRERAMRERLDSLHEWVTALNALVRAMKAIQDNQHWKLDMHSKMLKAGLGIAEKPKEFVKGVEGGRARR